jgi:thiamine pyrophosphate-dependent acetolactate synthase large subunit-like protein
LTELRSGSRAVTGADLIVSSLEAAGVDVVFGLPGVHNLALWRALSGSNIRLVTVRHEQAAAYAADGFARSTGRVGVALTTTGPGAANTLGAVGEAWAARSPVVVIATDIPSTIRRPGVYRGALHETTDQGAMFVPVTKRVLHVRDAALAGAQVEAALFEARAAPSRPVYVEVPTDLLSAEVRDEREVPEVRRAAGAAGVGQREPDGSAIEAALAVIDASERPLVWAGGGATAAGASEEVAMLAKKLAAPVFTTYQARGLIGDDPCAVGLPPHWPAAGALWDEADCVIAIGTDLDGMMTQNWRMPAPLHLVAVNVDPVDAAKSYSPEVTVVADAAAATRMLAEKVSARGGLRELGSKLDALRTDARRKLREEHPDAVEFLDEFDAALPASGVVFCDMCIPGYWLAGFHRVHGPRRLAYPVGWGTLGFAFPAAAGAAMTAPQGAPVVSVSGDGGFLFACGELATVAQEQPALTAVIVDDGGYGMLRYDQRHAGDEVFGVDLLTPDFAALARSFGIPAETVDGLGKEFGDALGAAVRTPGPSVVVAKAALDPPPTTSPRWYRAK